MQFYCVLFPLPVQFTLAAFRDAGGTGSYDCEQQLHFELPRATGSVTILRGQRGAVT